jgi:hypothetical protein
MENIKDDLIELNNILNKKYKSNLKLKLLKVNTNKVYNNTLQFDMIFLEKYKKYFEQDIILYNYIKSLPKNKRFKL